VTPSLLPKPQSELGRPELTRLPRLTPGRKLARRLLRGLARLAVWLCTRSQVSGLENVPRTGPALVVVNHLGDADLIVGLALSPIFFEVVSKVELYELPVVGTLMKAYGVIWIHRGQPDRRALHAVLDGLQEGRVIAIAPEGRESLSGALEQGTHGAAFLALKANVPVSPVTFTGTENECLYGNLRRLRRSPVRMTIGPPFKLEPQADHRQALAAGTRQIMLALARQLPPEYRGAYRDEVEQ
jgi:1-acyl-sn-glycerol-3-phosphate acyltransferase